MLVWVEVFALGGQGKGQARRSPPPPPMHEKPQCMSGLSALPTLHVTHTCSPPNPCLQGIAGFLGPATNWRVPFVVVSVPAIALNFLLFCSVRDPPRGGFEEALKGTYAGGQGASASLWGVGLVAC